MTQQEKEKMFLDLNSVLVKFWIEQGRPDKEVKIELLERMLNWYKKMGYVTLDKQKQPSEELEEEIDRWFGEQYMQNLVGLPIKPIVQIIAHHFAEWQEKQDARWAGEIHKNGYNLCKEQMLEDAVEGEIDWYDGPYLNYTTEQMLNAIERSGAEVGDKVKVIVVKED